MTTFIEKYKRIELGIPASADDRTNSAIATLNDHFRPDDFHIIVNGDAMEIWLRQVNLEDLAAALDTVAAGFGISKVTRQIYRAVEGIHGYGINGNKRLYAGYNDERKVIGRKEKSCAGEALLRQRGHQCRPVQGMGASQMVCRT